MAFSLDHLSDGHLSLKVGIVHGGVYRRGTLTGSLAFRIF